jgi:hypothetical protein
MGARGARRNGAKNRSRASLRADILWALEQAARTPPARRATGRLVFGLGAALSVLAAVGVHAVFAS